MFPDSSGTLFNGRSFPKILKLYIFKKVIFKLLTVKNYEIIIIIIINEYIYTYIQPENSNNQKTVVTRKKL